VVARTRINEDGSAHAARVSTLPPLSPSLLSLSFDDSHPASFSHHFSASAADLRIRTERNIRDPMASSFLSFDQTDDCRSSIASRRAHEETSRLFIPPPACARDRTEHRGRVESGDSAILARRVHTSAPWKFKWQALYVSTGASSSSMNGLRTPGQGGRRRRRRRVRKRGGGGSGADERVGAAVEAPRSTAERANTCVPFERACRQRGLRACTSTLGVRHDNTG